MLLPIEQCRQAARARDVQYDGQFFVGVLTTGVYCRAGCGGNPKPENILLFACAAAAEIAGYRPCKRCRPDASAGTPAWLPGSEVVSRALRMIGEGALDGEDGVDALAARVGLTSRQLRRLFAQHLGATPVEIASARRTHFARRLIDETHLPMTEIAFAAGFQSVRQFNHDVRETYHEAPTQLRQRRRREPRPDDGVTLRLPFRPPYDWRTLIDFLAQRALPGVERVEPDAYLRTVRLDDTPGVIEVRHPAGERYLTLRIHAESQHGLIRVVEQARRMFDLGADPREVFACLSKSRALAPLVAEMRGVRLPGAWDPFELAVRAVLGQQVTVQGARTLAARLVARFGTPITSRATELTRLFPTPHDLADADLASIGIPRARASALVNLARAVADGSLVLDAPQGLDEAVDRLRAIPGIGAWTAQYIAMRGLGERDAFPASDLGLRRALARGGASLSEAEVLRQAESWRPWRAYAAIALWSSLSREPRERKSA